MASLVSDLDSPDSSPQTSDDSQPSSWKSDGSSGGSSSGSSGHLHAWKLDRSGARRSSGRRSGRGVSDHNSDAFEAAFKHVVSPEEMAKADASSIRGPGLFDSGDGL